MKHNHDDLVEDIVERLWDKGRYANKFVPVRDYQGRLVSEADALTCEYRNGKVYLTRYEVKTGRGRKKAKYQAREWFKMYEGIGFIVPNLVYINPADNYKCKRWRPQQ